MDCEYSPCFSVTHATETVCTKIAPGMTYQFAVTFLPDDIDDYRHQIRFYSEGEEFVIPIIGKFLIKYKRLCSLPPLTCVFR